MVTRKQRRPRDPGEPPGAGPPTAALPEEGAREGGRAARAGPAALGLFLAAWTLALLLWDAAWGLRALSGLEALLLVIASLLAFLLLRRWLGTPPPNAGLRARTPAAALCALLALVSLGGHFLPPAASGGLPVGPAGSEADSTAAAVQADFDALFGRLSGVTAAVTRDREIASLLSQPAMTGRPREELFHRLEEALRGVAGSGEEAMGLGGIGVTLYAEGGEAIAWAGQVSSLPEEVLAAAPLHPVEGRTLQYAPEFAVHRYNRLASRLYCLHPFATPPAAIEEEAGGEGTFEPPRTALVVSERLLRTGIGSQARKLPVGFFPPAAGSLEGEGGLTLQFFLPDEREEAEPGPGRHPLLFPDGSLFALLHGSPRGGAGSPGPLALVACLLGGLIFLVAGLGAARRALRAADPGAPGCLTPRGRLRLLAWAGAAVASLLLLRSVPAWPGVRWWLARFSLFDPSSFSLPAPFGLLGSPGDLLLTSLSLLALAAFVLLLAWKAGRFGPAREAASGRASAWPAVLASLAFIALLLPFHALLARVVLEAPAGLTELRSAPGIPAAEPIRNALLLATLAVELLGLALLAFAGAGRRRLRLLAAWVLPGSAAALAAAWASPRLASLTGFWPFPGGEETALCPALAGPLLLHLLPLLFYLSFLATAGREPLRLLPRALLAFALLFYLPALAVHGMLGYHFERERRDFIRRELVPEVARLAEHRELLLARVLHRAAPRLAEVAARLVSAQPVELPGLAYSFWSGTELARRGYGSTVEIFDEEGRLASRFAYELPGLSSEEVELTRLATRETAEGLLLLGHRQMSVLSRSEELRWRGRSVGTLVLTVTVDYGDLEMLARANPYREMLRAADAAGRWRRAIFGDSPFLTVSGADGRAVFSSRGDAPATPREVAQEVDLRPAETVWWTTRLEDGPYRVAGFGDGTGRVFSLGYPADSPLDRAVQALRLLARTLALAVPAALFLLLLRRPAGGLFGLLEPSYYRKILFALLLIAVVPMGLLAFLFQRQLRSTLEEDLRLEGLRSLAAAGRVVEDFLASLGEGETVEGALTDDFLIWVSRLVDQDLHIYAGSTLAATSRRELFAIGLLPDRLEGEIYLDLAVRGLALHEDRRQLGEGSVLLLAVPVRSPAPGAAPAVLATPLIVQQRRIDRIREDVAGTVLVAFFLLVVFASLVSYPLARRISSPIRKLVEGTARLARGNFDVRIETRSRDEIKALVDSFNSMARELKGQREDLERRREYIEKILANAATGVLSLDQRGRVTTINPAAIRLLGLEGQRDLAGRPIGQLLSLHPPLSRLRELVERWLEHAGDGEWVRRHAGRVEEVRIPSGRASPAAGGEDRSLHLIFAPLGGAGEEGPSGTILVFEDITDLLRASRLDAWAEMARRVAHDIKNPLTPIQLHVEHLQRLQRNGDPSLGRVLEESAVTILRQVADLRQIARDFSEYSRSPRLEREPGVDPGGFVAAVVEPYQGRLDPGVELRLQVEPGLPPLALDRKRMRQALNNVLENAIQALDGGAGEIVVDVRALPGEDADGGGTGVEISITDSGAGMDRQTLERLFEPYFSTKDSGTGLGMALTRNTVAEHGGRINAASEAGRGTRVTIRLPAGQIPSA